MMQGRSAFSATHVFLADICLISVYPYNFPTAIIKHIKARVHAAYNRCQSEEELRAASLLSSLVAVWTSTTYCCSIIAAVVGGL